MRSMMVAAVAAVGVLLAGSAGSPAVSASMGVPGGAIGQAISPLEPVACVRGGPKCPPGRHWVCGPRGNCACVPC